MKKFWIVFLSLIFIVTGCSTKQPAKPNEVHNEAFESYLDELLTELYSPDNFSINFSFVDPSAYGIETEPYVLGFTSREDHEEGVKEAKEVVKELEGFKDKDLTLQQQIDKQALIEAFNESIAMGKYYDYEVGSGMLGYSRNVMGSLPAYLETYTFRNQSDVDGYFNLLETMPEYIQKYIDLELERQENGTGFGQEEINETIKVSEATYKDASTDSFYLIEYFNKTIDAVDFMDDAAKAEAKERNRTLLTTNFANSYKLVIDAFSAIDAKPSTGLVNKPNGKEYYELLIQQETGKAATIKDIEKLLDKKEKEIYTYFAANSDKLLEWENQMREGTFGEFADGRELLDSIQEQYTNDFPVIDNPHYVLRQVDESMKDSSSPAFYFSPPVDYTTEEAQVIYINGEFDNGLYTTYAHEGIPGHMYQFSYFLTLDEMHPIRSIISSTSNAEGWANYAEKEAVKYVADPEYAEFYSYYNMLIEIFHIRMDIGIHYEGWTFDQFKEYFTSQFGVDASEEGMEEELLSIYVQFVHNPAAFPTYYLSNIYIREMKLHAQQELDELYNEADFHKAILDVGAASVNVMEASVERYIEATKAK